MSYKKDSRIPKSQRLEWSPERGGKVRQKVGKSWVKKYSFSPFTAKAHLSYSFYADVEVLKVIESPAGVETKVITVPVYAGTYREFRDSVASGEALDRITEIVIQSGGEGVVDYGFWRTRELTEFVDEE